MILLLLVHVLKNEEKLDHRLMASKDKRWADLKTENKNKSYSAIFQFKKTLK